MAGGAYCSLSSQDPSQRLQILVKETQSHLVLVHSSTRNLFEIDIVTLNIDTIINNEANSTSINLNQTLDVPITSENILFVIFTSGSTGIPKAVCIISFFFDYLYFLMYCLMLFFLKIGSATSSKLY